MWADDWQLAELAVCLLHVLPFFPVYSRTAQKQQQKAPATLLMYSEIILLNVERWLSCTASTAGFPKSIHFLVPPLGIGQVSNEWIHKMCSAAVGSKTNKQKMLRTYCWCKGCALASMQTAKYSSELLYTSSALLWCAQLFCSSRSWVHFKPQNLEPCAGSTYWSHREAEVPYPYSIPTNASE